MPSDGLNLAIETGSARVDGTPGCQSVWVDGIDAVSAGVVTVTGAPQLGDGARVATNKMAADKTASQRA